MERVNGCEGFEALQIGDNVLLIPTRQTVENL
jgi:hypothetical protein